jgi:hypothetical protein
VHLFSQLERMVNQQTHYDSRRYSLKRRSSHAERVSPKLTAEQIRAFYNNSNAGADTNANSGNILSRTSTANSISNGSGNNEAAAAAIGGAVFGDDGIPRRFGYLSKLNNFGTVFIALLADERKL